VTGHKFKIHWSNMGMDFMALNVELSERWEAQDKHVYLVHNFTDQRAHINVTYNWKQVMNDTIYKSAPGAGPLGSNIVYNDTDVREFHVVFNGADRTQFKRRNLKIVGQRCSGSCLPPVTTIPIETNFRYWSNPASWDTGAVPVANDTVEIKPGWNMVFDVAESPIIKQITVNGRLSFKNDTDLHLRTKQLFIRAGELVIGYKDKPFANKAIITLHGERNSQTIVYDGAVEAGNKNIANVGKISMYGPRRNATTRLFSEAIKGKNTFMVAPGLDWKAGDRIALAPTSFAHAATDDLFISSYDAATGKVTTNTSVGFYHWGQPNSTASTYGADIRGEVMLLTRNILIRGEDIEAWGCNILTGDLIEADLSVRAGTTIMDAVEIYNCTQANTQNAALRWQNAQMGYSEVTNSAIHNGLGWGVTFVGSANVRMTNNVMYGFMNFGVNVIQGRNFTFDDNIVVKVTERFSFVST